MLFTFIYIFIVHFTITISNNLLTGFSRDVFAFLQPHTERRTENCRGDGARLLFGFVLSLVLRAGVRVCVCVRPSAPDCGGVSARLGQDFRPPSCRGIVFNYNGRARKKGKKRRAPNRRPPKIHKMYFVLAPSFSLSTALR